MSCDDRVKRTTRSKAQLLTSQKHKFYIVVFVVGLLLVGMTAIGAGVGSAAATTADGGYASPGDGATALDSAAAFDGNESTSATAPESSRDNETEPGRPPGGDPDRGNETDALVDSELTAGQTVFESRLFTVEDIVTFGYQNGTQVTTPTGTYTLDRGDARVDNVPQDTYQIVGDSEFTTLWGDPVSRTVMGYFAMGADGAPLNTEIHTYIPAPFDQRERFVVFGYENGTSVTITNSQTGGQIWSGTLNESEHATLQGSSLPHSTFVTVESSKPVSAQTYFDQGFYVPAKSGQWSGKQFYTFVDNLGGWTNDVVVNAFNDDTNVTISNLETGKEIWSGTLDAAEAHNEGFTEATYVKIETDEVVTVGARPWESWSPSANYHEGSSVPSQSGSRIGSDFMVPTLGPDYTYVLAYENDTDVTVINTDTDQVAGTYTLDRGEAVDVNPGEGLWRILSDKEVAVQAGWGEWSASFAPVEFGESESAVIEGTVFDDEDQPVANANVSVFRSWDWFHVADNFSIPLWLEPVTTTQTDADGTYRTGDLGSGRYFVFAEKGDQSPGLSKPVVVPRTTDPVTVNVTLRGELYPVIQEMESIDDAARDAIDENTESAAEVYIEGYDTFVDPSFADRLAPTDLHDGINLAITAIDLSLAAADPDPTSLVRDELEQTIAEKLGWNLVDHGLHYSYTGQFVSLDEARREEIVSSAESIVDEDWLESYSYTSSKQEAINNGYSNTSVYKSAMDRLDRIGDDYQGPTDGFIDGPIDENFSVSETTEVLSQQEEWLRGEGPVNGVVITPQGNVYMIKQSQVHQNDFDQAKTQAERAEIGATVMDGVQTAGSAAIIFGDPTTKTAGAVAQGVGTAGKIAFKTYGVVAENRMAKQWSNTQIHWADDTATIPEVKNESSEWLQGEVTNPTLPYADAAVDIDINSSVDIDGTPVVAANRPDYPWYMTGAQSVALKNATVTVENTGDLDTAETRVLLTDQYADEDGNNAVSEMATVHPGPEEDPMSLARSDGERDIELPFAAEFSPLDPLQSHSLTADVWVEGKLDDSATIVYYVVPSLDLPSLPSFVTYDTSTTDQQSLMRTGDYAYTTAGADSDVSITQSTFQSYLGNVSEILTTDLSPERIEANTTYQADADTSELTFLMVAERGSDINLHAYDENNRHVGFDPATAEDEVQIPGAEYTGNGSKIQRITINDPEQEEFELETRAGKFTTNASRSVQIFAIPTPDRPAILGSSPADTGMAVSPGEKRNTTFELAEIGGNESVDGIVTTVGQFETAGGVELPNEINTTVTQSQTDIAPGEEMDITVRTEVPENVTFPDVPETRYTGNITVETANAGQLNLTLSVLILNTSDRTVTLKNAQETIDGVSVVETQSDKIGIDDADLPAFEAVNETYDSEIVGTGNLSITFTNRSDSVLKTVYGVHENGSVVKLTTVRNTHKNSLTATVENDEIASEDLDAIVVATDYADRYTNEDGVVLTSGLLSAIDEWREDRISLDLVFDAITYWRSGTPVE